MLAAHLAVLTAALEHPDSDLEADLRVFAAQAKRAVLSYSGMTLTLALDAHDVSFTVHDDPTVVPATSLLIPLDALAPGEAASTLLLYAATPGAFVDLSADLGYALGIDPAGLVLDAHLPAPEGSSGMTGLGAHLAIEQAIGVLIGRGYPPEAARDELHRHAGLGHGDLHSAAEALLRGAGAEPTDEP